MPWPESMVVPNALGGQASGPGWVTAARIDWLGPGAKNHSNSQPVERAASSSSAGQSGETPGSGWVFDHRSQHESRMHMHNPDRASSEHYYPYVCGTASLRLNATNENLSTTAGGDEDWATTAAKPALLLRARSVVVDHC